MTQRFESNVQNHTEGGAGSDDQEDVLAPSRTSVHVQQPDARLVDKNEGRAEESRLLPGGTNKASTEFTSTDGFSVLYLLQGSCVGILFFVVPLIHREGGSDATNAQFFWVEVGTFFFMLLGAVCLVVDGSYFH